MNRRDTLRVLVFAMAVSLASFQNACLAQSQPKAFRVGVISAGTVASVGFLIDAFAQGMKDLGYEDGRNVVIERRYADSKPDRLPGLAAELVALNCDVIYAPTPPAALAAQKGSARIPIVFALVQDPVGAGFVASLARPGGNMTGLTDISADLVAKRLELLAESLPKLTRAAVFYTSAYPGAKSQVAALERTAKGLGKELLQRDVLHADEFEAAFAELRRGRTEGVVVIDGPLFFVNRKALADQALRSRMPAIFNARESVEAGGLMSYGAGYAEIYRRAASYVDKILKGAKPGDLPVEQPSKFEMVVNLKTAKAPGLKIPQSILVQATEVIE